MRRYVFRRGFSLQPTQTGVGHLTDTRTGDALVVPMADATVLAAAAKEGLDPQLPLVADILARYGLFLMEAPAFESAADELKLALEAMAQSAAPEFPLEGERPGPSGLFLSQEENLRQALQKKQASEPEPESLNPPMPVAVVEVPIPVEVPAPAPVPAKIPLIATPLVSPTLVTIPSSKAHLPAHPSRRPVGITVLAVVVLLAGVVTSFLLRASKEAPEVSDEAIPEPSLQHEDAATASVTIDAGIIASAPTLVVPTPKDILKWHEVPVQARGRVTMGEVVAAADGTVKWTVSEGKRVKSKQKLGTLTRKAGAEQPITADAVGVALLKQPSLTVVKRGTVLAEVVYFEAWGRAIVRGFEPDSHWRCEVVSAEVQERADCRVSVIAPRSGGIQVTVAVEPRWFDTASDAVLRLLEP